MMLEICKLLIHCKIPEGQRTNIFWLTLKCHSIPAQWDFHLYINSLSAGSTGGEFPHKKFNSVIKKCLRSLKQNEAVNRETF